MRAKVLDNSQGWTIIELMVVVGVIAILAAIAIPNFLGFQERAKRKVMKEVASSSKPDLYNWMGDALKREGGVVDVNGNGLLEPGEIHTNLISVPNSWIQAFANKAGYTPLSPWDNNKKLFTVGPFNPPNSGQITFSRFNGGRGIRIVAFGKGGETLFNDSVSVD